MTTHLRARAAQASAFLALVIGGVAVLPAAAQADQPGTPGVLITDLSPTAASGSKITLSYTVSNTNQNSNPDSNANIQVNGMPCRGDCTQSVPINAGEKRQFTAFLTAPQVDTGQSQSIQVSISVTINNVPNNITQTVTVQGPKRAQTVRQITGKVRDQTGQAISGANVGIEDSAGNHYQTTSDGSGGYSITSSPAQPIVPGLVKVAAIKDGFEIRSVEVQAAADRTVSVQLMLKASAAATPSATPSATVSPTNTAATTTQPTTQFSAAPPIVNQAPSAASTTAANAAASNNNSGSSLWLFFILGGLLVAAGVGAIVLVMMRRKNDHGDDPDFGGPGTGPSGPGSGPMIPSQNRYASPTRVTAPVGAPGMDATMVAPMSAAPALSDAPTMLHRPASALVDEFPDPYGAPIPQQRGYQGASNWADQPAGYGAEAQQFGAAGYTAGNSYDQTPSQNPYGVHSPAGFVAQPDPGQRYDEPTGMYQPESSPEAGYGAPGDFRAATQADYGTGVPSGYGTAQPGYANPPASYGTPAGGYGTPPGGYDAAPGGHDNAPGGYDSTPAAGYDNATASGYDNHDGYAAGAPQFHGGYGAAPDSGAGYPTGGEQGGAYGTHAEADGLPEAGGYSAHPGGAYGHESVDYPSWNAPDGGTAYGAPDHNGYSNNQYGGADQGGAPQFGGSPQYGGGSAYTGGPQYGSGHGTPAPSGGYGDQTGYDPQSIAYGAHNPPPAGRGQSDGYPHDGAGYEQRPAHDPPER